jgi:hypothetical protein
LHRGYVFRSKLGLEDHFSQWHDDISTELLFASYSEFTDRWRERRPLGREHFGRLMVSLAAKPKRLCNAANGEHVTDVQTPFGTQRKAQPALHPRPPGYGLGALDKAREVFIALTRLPVDWQDSDAPAKAA